MTSRIKPTLFVALAGVMLISACGGSSPAAEFAAQPCGSGEVVSGRPLQIVSTVAPITSIIANVVGGSGAVVNGLVPEGTNSHTFEPPPSAAKVLEESDVVFINGLVLEEPTKDLAEANIASGAEVCEIATELLPESEWIYDFSFPKDGGKPNPHLWTNPPMVKEYAQVVRDTLVKRNPENAEVFNTNFTAFAAKVDEIDAAMQLATETIPAADRKLLTYHDAYAYFARHYNWTVVGAIQPSSFEEPTPKEVAELITQVKEEKVKAVFGSEVFPSPVLEQIGKETNAKYIDVLRDDDLPGEPGDPEHSWMGLMRFNFVTMVEALGGDASALKALDVNDVVKDSAVYPQ